MAFSFCKTQLFYFAQCGFMQHEHVANKGVRCIFFFLIFWLGIHNHASLTTSDSTKFFTLTDTRSVNQLGSRNIHTSSTGNQQQTQQEKHGDKLERRQPHEAKLWTRGIILTGQEASQTRDCKQTRHETSSLGETLTQAQQEKCEDKLGPYST